MSLARSSGYGLVSVPGLKFKKMVIDGWSLARCAASKAEDAQSQSNFLESSSVFGRLEERQRILEIGVLGPTAQSLEADDLTVGQMNQGLKKGMYQPLVEDTAHRNRIALVRLNCHQRNAIDRLTDATMP